MAAIWRWRESSKVIAHLIPEKVIKGLFKRNIVLNPGEAVILIKEGKFEESVTQAKLEKIGGGLGNWWNRWRGKESGTELLFLITTPIDLEIPLDEKTHLTTKDHQKMYGTSTVRFQFLPEDVNKIINLMDRKPLLTKDKLINKINDELISMVFSTQIAKYNAEEFHGNVDIIKEMETAATVEMRKSFGLWGLNLIKMFTVWGKNEYDELMEYKTKLSNFEGKEDAYHTTLLGQVQRQHEYNRKIHECKWDLRLSDVTGEERLKTERTLAELERDRAQHEEEIRQKQEELELERTRGKIETDKDREEMEIAMDAFKDVQAAKRDRKKMDQDFKTEQMAIQTGSMERIMDKAIDSGAADSETVKEMLRQQTMQKALDREPEKVGALSGAEKSRFDLETYKAAEDRDREYEATRMELTAKQMEAGKQKLPDTLVQGASSTPVVTQIAPQQQPTMGGEDCWNCGKTMGKGTKVCPHCGEAIE